MSSIEALLSTLSMADTLPPATHSYFRMTTWSVSSFVFLVNGLFSWHETSHDNPYSHRRMIIGEFHMANEKQIKII
jgi:hypothetical protein